MSEPVRIKKGEKSDLPAMLKLVKELALYEKAPHEVTNNLELMEQDGFGPAPIFGFLVAEKSGNIVGISVYYYRYSTWKGKRLYLEDIVVTEKERGNGIGKMLFDETMKTGKETGCTGMMWQVLDWNEPGLNFYKKYYNPKMDYEWVNCHLDF